MFSKWFSKNSTNQGGKTKCRRTIWLIGKAMYQETHATEMPDQRVTRLQQVRVHLQETLTVDTTERRTIWLQVDRERL